MKISVIIPVYNVAPWLSPCLDSVLVAARRLAEHRPDCQVEVICVDDGSTDGSGKILETWAAANTHPPTPNSQLTTQIIHQANRGVAAARNAALDVATGEWVLFVDADDVLRSDCAEVLSDVVSEHSEADIVTFGLSHFADGVEPDLDGAFDGFDHELAGWFCMRLYRRALIESAPALRFPLLTNGEDEVFLVEATMRADRIVSCGATLYGYRQRKGSASAGRTCAARVHSLIESARLISETLSRAARRLSPLALHRYANKVTEGLAYWTYQVPAGERRQNLRQLREFWKFLCGLPLLSPWQRRRLVLFGWCPLLFALIGSLKRRMISLSAKWRTCV